MTVSTACRSLDKLWYTRCPVPTASGIAIHKGWLDQEFAPDGITISSLSASPSQTIRESHFDHGQAESFRHGGNAPPIWARSEGRDVVVVGLTWLPQYQSILALPGSGIKSVRDLKGKRLALPRRTTEKIDFWRASALQGYLQALATEGLTSEDVIFVDLPILDPYIGKIPISSSGTLFDVHQFASSARAETFALIRGEVDALYNYGAAGPSLQEYLGANTVIDINHYSDPAVAINNGTPNVLSVSGTLVREHPEIVARYLSQVLRAAKWAQNNRREARQIIAREVAVADEWMPQAFDDELYSNLEPSLEPSLIHALATRKSFLLQHGFIKNDFSIEDWVCRGPLARAHEILATEHEFKEQKTSGT